MMLDGLNILIFLLPILRKIVPSVNTILVSPFGNLTKVVESYLISTYLSVSIFFCLLSSLVYLPY